MGQPALVELRGAVTLSPVGGCCSGSGSVSDTMQVNICAAYGASQTVRLPVAGTVDLPTALALQGIAKVRFLSIKSVSGSQMKLLVTSPNGGANQVIPFTDLVLHCPNNGDEMTALSLIGNGDVYALLAGDAG